MARMMMYGPDRPPMLFAPGASEAFAGRVAQELGIGLSPLEEREFEDGEHKARPLVSVRGGDVFVLHSLYADAQQSGNDKLCRLLFFIGALKDAGAARVTALVPYLAYARKDRKTKPRDPVTTRYVAALFEAVGTDAVVTADVHNLAAFQNAFRCGADNLEADALFVAHFTALLGAGAGAGAGELAVVAPDTGGIKRAQQFRDGLSRALGRPVGTAFVEKYRSGGTVSGGMLVGDVAGKDVVVIDDLIGSGTTLARAASACRAHGARRVYAAATHGLFLDDAPGVLAASALEGIAVTDTVPPLRLAGTALQARVSVLGCAGLFAAAVARIHGAKAGAPEGA
ncbi:MAG: ribose-phosphate pyrophosphokinase [Telluria sp.]